MKTCITCRENLDLSEFYRRFKNGPTKGKCKKCCLRYAFENRVRNYEAQKARAAKNPEALAAKRHEYYLRNRNRIKTQAREWKLANKERVAATQAKWRSENAEWAKEYAKSNNLRLREHWRIRRRRESGHVDYAFIYERDRGVCHICGDVPTNYHFDHVIPLARGGPHVAENIKVACATCNLRKGARLLAA